MELQSVNGLIGGTLSPLDRGLAYGDGLFETLRLHDGQPRFWSYHMERLREGCRRLRIPLQLDNVGHWFDALTTQCGQSLLGDSVAKIMVTRGCGGRGYRPDFSMQPTVVITLHSYPPSSETELKLRICQHRLPTNPALAGIKHLNRLDNVLLQAECSDHNYSDGLVLDTDNNVIETTSSNLFFERNKQLYTPKLDRCGVEGVMRRVVIERLSLRAEVFVSVEPINAADIVRFDGAFACNSVRGIVPVVAIDKYPLSKTPLTLRLQQMLTDADLV